MSRLSFGTTYQWVLIALGLLATLLFGAFFYRELFPEYRIYQDDYIALEQFRSTYTHEPPPPFKEGVKQILIEREDKGPPLVDRCISCHVALQVEAFSPTRIERDLNGNIVYDTFGVPAKEENPGYIWKKLEEALPEHPELESLKTAHVRGQTYDMRKVLAMHPLMGRETRPFEYHPIEEYGCTSCHGGNGNGLVSDRAHGPVFDGEYEEESHGFVPQFLEKDPENDPPFSRVFNAKPGHRLLFQTNPIYVGALIQAKCMQCHQSSQDRILNAANSASVAVERNKKEIAFIQKGLDFEKEQVAALLMLQKQLKNQGYSETLAYLEKQSLEYTLPYQERSSYAANYRFLKELHPESALQEIERQLLQALGDTSTAQLFEKEGIESALEQKKTGSGTLYEKLAALNNSKEMIQHIQDVSGKFNLMQDENAIGYIQSDVDLLTKDYQKGQALFLSQGCYACHRISGRSRGGVGPELSRSGDGYPWFIKESIVWPQADLRTSTMPNFRLDHDELESLTTYLLGQSSKNKTMSDTERKISLAAWEAGKKMPWELPVSQENVQNLNYGMTVFAVEGCASCHRLKGYESNVGFKADSGEELQKERKWFETLFPESILGSQIVSAVEKNQKEIDARIADNVREGSLLETIEEKHPGAIEALYSNFKFALRAKKTEEWKNRVRRVLKMYIQTYGLGRLICPRPNWAGVYRSDQWLMEHFKNPTSHVPRSIMPVFPFDDSKFYALTYTLDQLAEKNREVVQKFEPAVAYKTYCAQCHGTSRQGDGPVSEWIYPIPKNLLRAEFLRQLTKEQAIQSIAHGVKGTPMPPWGEVGEGKDALPILTEDEIVQLVDWLYSSLPLQSVLPDESPKWNYQIDDVMRELKNEGNSESDIFDHGYIKQGYYTAENIQAGKRFFIENCAPCHGNEGDGSGLRAEAMADAKPRMLTNLDWISSRDDLRLLRSIKYGVPGTAMTPWGDLTSSKQRLQLVMFIRSLSREAEERRRLTDTIYKAFEWRGNGEKEIYYKIGMGFISLGASEKIQQEFLDLILQKGSEEALMKSIDQEIQKNGSEGWKKQKTEVISGLAEINRMEKK